MNLKFYSYDDMRKDTTNEGRVLLRVLAMTEPNTFGDALAYLLLAKSDTTLNPSISGLLVKREGTTVVCVASVSNVKIDRIYTIPRFRKLGHAKTLLSLLTAFSMFMNFSFVSPVNPDVIPVFLSAGWKFKAGGPNKDGTRQMASNLPRLSNKMDVSRWAVALESFNQMGV